MKAIYGSWHRHITGKSEVNEKKRNENLDSQSITVKYEKKTKDFSQRNKERKGERE